MDVVEFLFPEALCTDGNGMSRELPKPAVSVRAGRLPENVGEETCGRKSGAVGRPRQNGGTPTGWARETLSE